MTNAPFTVEQDNYASGGGRLCASVHQQLRQSEAGPETQQVFPGDCSSGCTAVLVKGPRACCRQVLLLNEYSF